MSAYFLLGEQLVVGEAREPTDVGIAGEALRHLLDGPDAFEEQLGVSSAIPSRTRLRGISISDGVARVDLTGEFASGGGSMSLQARVAQIVYTATQFRSIDGVRFAVDGEEVDVLGGEGMVVDRPLRRSDFEFGGDYGDASLVPPVLVETPRLGAGITSPVRVTGSANVFEAVFQLEIVDGAGEVVAAETIMATSGTGDRGTFDATITFDDTTPGRGAIRTFVRSARDGSRQDQRDVPVTIG